MASSVLVGLCTLLLDYLDGKKNMRDCAEWLAGVDWDDPTLDAQTKQLLGRCELLTTEVGEGLTERRPGLISIIPGTRSLSRRYRWTEIRENKC